MGHSLLRVMEGNPCLEGFAFGGPVGDGSQREEGQSKLVDKTTIHVRARPHVETVEHQHVERVVRTALPMIGRTQAAGRVLLVERVVQVFGEYGCRGWTCRMPSP
jgi:hypothetical protein